MNLSKDIVGLIGLKLDYKNILNFSLASKNIRKCLDNDFWRNKLYQEYPFSEELQKNFDTMDFQQLYKNIQFEIKFVTTANEKDFKLLSGNPQFFHPALTNFLLHANYGVTLKTNVPLNYVLWPLVKKGIISQKIMSGLICVYLKDNIIIENGEYYGKVTDDMRKYLGQYSGYFKDKIKMSEIYNLFRHDISPYKNELLKTIPIVNLCDIIKDSNDIFKFLTLYIFKN